MYRFQVVCGTEWGESVFVVGSPPCLGAWDPSKAIPLAAEHYPCWKSAEVDLSAFGPRVEYKYIKRGPGGAATWEPGPNRWVPVDLDPVNGADGGRAGGCAPSEAGSKAPSTPARLTVHGGDFGASHPEPFSFSELVDDRPRLEDVGPQQRRVVVIGSSVAEGYNAWRKRGWAWQLGEALRERYGYFLANVSQSGANTQVTKERFMQAVEPWRPDIVIVGLSLGNEGLAHCPPGERRAAQHRFEQGVLDLLRMVVSINAVPVLGGVYPNNDFVPETYAMLKETRRTMLSWGVPVLDWLDALDDGHGRWSSGLFFDHAHPNTEGHRKMLAAIDLELFDPAPSSDVPALIRRRSSLNQFDTMERKTSYSNMDPEVVASTKEADERAKQLAAGKAFDDGRGFTIVVSGGAVSVRNKTEFEYQMTPEWGQLCDSLTSAGLRPGIYASHDGNGSNGPAAPPAVLHVGVEARLANSVKVPPGADLVFVSMVPGAGRDR